MSPKKVYFLDFGNFKIVEFVAKEMNTLKMIGKLFLIFQCHSAVIFFINFFRELVLF